MSAAEVIRARDLPIQWPFEEDEPTYVRPDGGVLTDTSFRFDDDGQLVEVVTWWDHPRWDADDLPAAVRRRYSTRCAMALTPGGLGGDHAVFRRRTSHQVRYRPGARVACEVRR